MSDEKLLTVREVAHVLRISEKDVINLAEQGVIPAYKIGGVYLRFKQEQVIDFKNSANPILSRKDSHTQEGPNERLFDFLYKNDFYIVTALIILALLFVIFRGY